MSGGNNALRVVSKVLIFGALIFVFFAVSSVVKTKILLANGDRIEGKVVEIIEVWSNEGLHYWPVFEYKDKKNNEVLYKSEVGVGTPEYTIGAKVEMVYNRDKEEVKVVSFWSLYKWVVVLLFFGLIFLVPGLGIRWMIHMENKLF